MRRAFLAPALLAAITWSTAAIADPTPEALRLYGAGEFVAAANLAAAQHTPADLTFVANALLAACATAQPSDIDALLARAASNARSALDLDQSSVAARINLALAYGMMGKRASLSDAISHNYAGRGRRLINEALLLDPNNARAHALLGAWHFEVVRRGGRLGAMAYGARLAEGTAEFRRGEALAPGDPLIRLQHALALLQLDPAANAASAGRLLADVVATPAGDALEQAAQSTAQRLITAIASGPQAAGRAARESFL